MPLRMSAAAVKRLGVQLPAEKATKDVRGTQERSDTVSAGVSKYGARRTEVDGIVFDSKRESQRYSELRLMEAAGQISGLETKTPGCVFQLVVNGVKIGRFTADFRYTENGETVIEDSKSGVASRDYILRKKLMLACHGIAIRETK